MRAGHVAEFVRPLDTGEAHEVLNRVLVRAASLRIGQVGEPFDLWRHVGQAMKIVGSQNPVRGRNNWRGFGSVGHGHTTIDKIRYQ